MSDVVGPMLMLPWYNSAPLPDKTEPPKAKSIGFTVLSQRLERVLAEQLFCDVVFLRGQEVLCRAHRVVLRRNPTLNLQFEPGGNGSVAPSEVALTVPDAVSAESLREVVRLHYLEVDQIGLGGALDASRPALLAAVDALKGRTSAEEWRALESVFGVFQPHAVASWEVLRTAVATERFADCALRVAAGGVLVPAHRVVVAGVGDGHYFSASLRWPGGDGAAPSVSMPEGLSQEALMALLRLRYGGDDVDLDCVLEARHFAEILDWPLVQKLIEDRLEALLADAGQVDAESLLAVLSHAEESLNMPPRLKVAALSAAIRHWSKVTEVAAADDSLPRGRRAELGVMSRIRRRDGHVCSSLEEYLHAAADDLVEWESSLGSGAPVAVRKKLDSAWEHWHQMLFEYGYLFGAATAEQWRERVAARREAFREERSRKMGAEMRLPAGRVWFEATVEWREVPQNAICPGGLEYRFDMQTGRNYARISA